jgi:hypothetical protein
MMSNNKNPEFGEELPTENFESHENPASRARNRTVMLTPEVTGEVRARLAEEAARGAPQAPPQLANNRPMVGSNAGFSAMGSSPQLGDGFVRPGGALQGSRPPTPVTPQPAFNNSYGAGAATPAPAAAGEQVVWAKQSKVIGFLVSYDANQHGDVFELRKGRLIVTSELASGGNFLVIQDETVSPMHAIIRIGDQGDVQVLDQLSEYGTTIIPRGGKERQLSGDKSAIQHGDIVRFGKRNFHVCLVLTEGAED